MAKGGWISDEIEKEIYSFVLSQRANLKRKKILDGLTRHLKKEYPDYKIPENSTLLNIISKIRNTPDPEGGSWNFGAKAQIPSEAWPAVLQAWKVNRLEGSSFTIREAKWCARLSALIKDSSMLRDWASVYANRELAYEILGKENEFDTSDFDILLTTPPWEFATGYLTGEIKPVVHGIFTFRKIGRRVVPTDKESSIFELPLDEKALVTIAVAPLVLHSHAFTAECEFLELSDLYPGISGNLPTTSFEEFSEEQIRVFVLWLHYLTKGPRIKSLKGETDMKKLGEELDRRKQIIHELHEWVKSHRLAKDSACLGPVVPHKGVLDFLAPQYNLKPVELLKKVGYEA
jgi:hypothetical protein